MRNYLFIVLALLNLPFNTFAAQEEPLDPAVAFRVELSAPSADTVQTHWTIADGYYLYGSKFRFLSKTPGVELGEAQIPPGKIKHDEFFGDVAIHRHEVDITIPVTRGPDAPNDIAIEVTSQGCADMGICYPPQRDTLKVTLPVTRADAANSTSANPIVQQLGLGNDAEDEPLDPDVAFQFSATVSDANTLNAHWDIAPGYYLYRDKFSFALEGADGVALAKPELPQGETKDDEFFGRIQIFHNGVDARLPLQRSNPAASEVQLKVSYQGCASMGICYPPQKKTITLALPASVAAPAAGTSQTKIATAPTSDTTTAAPLSEQDSLAQSLAGGSTMAAIALFFGLGLLLAFTPCVFPMIPILSSIIVGQGEGITTRKAFVLSLVYVLAMALTYTVAGVLAGLFGGNIQAAFQAPWVLISFSAVFVALALSMFGFYELQLPSALQSKLSEISNRQEGGSLLGVAVMGLLSALIVGPCVAPPLMGALIYIGQTGDPWLGGLALFALSMGMGAPLVVIGTAGGKLLPRAGGWMDAVKAVFGVLLLAVAVWMLERILPGVVVLILWAVLALASAVYMGALEPLPQPTSGWRKLWKTLGLVLLLWGAAMLIGAAGGASDPLNPLGGLRAAPGYPVAGAAQAAHLNFKSIKTAADLDREVELASAQGKTVMLDFYADWCVSCKEFEKYTFADPRVIQTLSGTVLLQADVTANDDADKALLKRFELLGPPSILFFDRDGKEQRNLRVVGYMDANRFMKHLNQALN